MPPARPPRTQRLVRRIAPRGRGPSGTMTTDVTSTLTGGCTNPRTRARQSATSIYAPRAYASDGTDTRVEKRSRRSSEEEENARWTRTLIMGGIEEGYTDTVCCDPGRRQVVRARRRRERRAARHFYRGGTDLPNSRGCTSASRQPATEARRAAMRRPRITALYCVPHLVLQSGLVPAARAVVRLGGSLRRTHPHIPAVRLLKLREARIGGGGSGLGHGCVAASLSHRN